MLQEAVASLCFLLKANNPGAEAKQGLHMLWD